MSRAAINLLADASIRSAVMTGLVWAALRAFRVGDSAVQHTAWAVMLASMLTMPLLSAVAPDVTVPWPRVTAIESLIDDPIAQSPSEPSHPARPNLSPGASAFRPSTQVAVSNPQMTAPARSASWSAIVFGIYLAITGLMLARFGLGWRRASEIVRRSMPVSLPTSLSVSPVSVSHQLVAPATIGILTAVVVLPSSWRSWSETKLRAVLAHERAHLKRHDPLVACLARLNICLFWFHPAAWWIERKLTETSELACDEAGAAEVGDRREYAAIVSDMAADVSRHGARVSWTASGIGGSHLRTRLEQLANAPAGRASVIARSAIPVACVSAVIVVAGCRTAEPPARISDERAAELRWKYADETTVREEDRRDYEAMLLNAQGEDPSGPGSTRLGRFYASSMLGHDVMLDPIRVGNSPSGPRFQEITGADWNSSTAKRAREILAASSDPVLLVGAAQYLRVGTPRPRPSTDSSPSGRDEYSALRRAFEEERDALVRAYLERAVALDPDLASARAELVSFRSGQRRDGDWTNLREVPPATWYEAISALDERERFERLPYAATGALSSTRVERFKDPNLDEYIAIREQQARKFAQDLLALAQKFTDHPDYGTAIFKAHITLGSLSLRQGDARAAAEHLLLAADAPVSEEIAYGRSFAYTRLVGQLMTAGERDAAALYLERMAGKSVVDRDRLLQEAQSVRDGAATLIFGPGYMSY